MLVEISTNISIFNGLGHKCHYFILENIKVSISNSYSHQLGTV